MKNRNHINSVLILLTIFLVSCKEPFEIESIEYLETFVVESTITNELKQQQVKLTKTYQLDSQVADYENNATVSIMDSSGNNFAFSQNAEGIYVSDQAFQAVENRTYQLFITTQNGKQYSSNKMVSAPVSEITNLYAEFITKEDEESGIQVFIDSDNSNNDAQYFRYEYEETYKIIAPEWFNLDITMENFREHPIEYYRYDIIIKPKEQEEEVCYKTVKSMGIYQTSTGDLEQNKILRFPILFINENSSVIRHRYSILVRQYVQNIEAYTFYKMIDDVGDSGSILSPTQPGFVPGNINSVSNESEKILGYFDVSTVDVKRIYFDYSNFMSVPSPYPYTCPIETFNYGQYYKPNERLTLYKKVMEFGFKLTSDPGSGTAYSIVNPECGNCTFLGSNIKPDFWVD